MGGTLESLVKKGFVFAAALGLHCATTYAQRDYDQYPAYRKEIALHNLQEIAKNICNPWVVQPLCDEMDITEEGIKFTTKGSPSFPKYVRWDQITKVVSGKEMVKVCDYGKKCINMGHFRDTLQTADFAKAIRVYVGLQLKP
ncbi:hypothetical protein HYX14_02990 [Candidatus Woesearchaeota archaeon]|nr:hypothetical protein [Candidatus Woesearchaeota archaeon]